MCTQRSDVLQASDSISISPACFFSRVRHAIIRPSLAGWATAVQKQIFGSKEDCATRKVPHPKIGQIVGFWNVCDPQMDPGLAVWPEIESSHTNF